MSTMKALGFIINIIILFLISIVFLTVFVIIIVAKLLNLISGFILVHLASKEFRER